MEPKSELELKERKIRVEKAKANSHCRICGVKGHWGADCKKKPSDGKGKKARPAKGRTKGKTTRRFGGHTANLATASRSTSRAEPQEDLWSKAMCIDDDSSDDDSEPTGSMAVLIIDDEESDEELEICLHGYVAKEQTLSPQDIDTDEAGMNDGLESSDEERDEYRPPAPEVPRFTIGQYKGEDYKSITKENPSY